MTKPNFVLTVLLPIILMVVAIAWTRGPTPKTNVTAPVKAELIIFSATWCGACQLIKNDIDQIEASGVKVTRVDIDKQPELAAKYQVMSVPTMILTNCGPQHRSLERTQDIADVIRWLRELRQSDVVTAHQLQ